VSNPLAGIALECLARPSPNLLILETWCAYFVLTFQDLNGVGVLTGMGRVPSGVCRAHHWVVDIELLYFDHCPNWDLARERLDQALTITGHSNHKVNLIAVETDEQARTLSFPGSPTIRINGRDPFPAATETYGLTCRVYPTADGIAGAPTVEELVQALVEPR